MMTMMMMMTIGFIISIKYLLFNLFSMHVYRKWIDNRLIISIIIIYVYVCILFSKWEKMSSPIESIS